MKTIANRLQTVYQAIQDYQNQHGLTSAVSLLAVSKTKPVDDIEQAYQHGQRLFAENYVQEGVDKITRLKHLNDICWHFIGPLQSNKTKLVAEHFDWMQTLAREKIARRLSEQRPAHLPPLNVLIQVNISGENSKAGIAADEVMSLATKIQDYPGISLRGLMCIGSPDASLKSGEYQQMQALFSQLSAQLPNVDTLSMGMSDDWQLALDFDSTMIRLGTAIFGSRQ